jgi:TonB family protein
VRFHIRLCQFAILVILNCSFYLSLRGQDRPDIAGLASRAASQIVKSGPKRVFIGSFSDCLLNTQMCESLDLNIRALVAAAVPNVKFLGREDAVPLLESRKFLSIDSYDSSIVRPIVQALGVDAVVVENLVWKEAYYELVVKIIDVKTDQELHSYSIKTFHTAADNDQRPIFFRDSADGPFLMIPRGDPAPFPPISYVACEKCPDPKYSQEARDKRIEGQVVFMATVSEQGLATQIALISSIDPGLAENAFQTLLTWRFKPAVGADGKAVAVRIPMQFTFRLSH